MAAQTEIAPRQAAVNDLSFRMNVVNVVNVKKNCNIATVQVIAAVVSFWRKNVHNTG